MYFCRSYPTTIFFNSSRPHYYHGEHSAGALAEFVTEVLRPSVRDGDFKHSKGLLMQ